MLALFSFHWSLLVAAVFGTPRFTKSGTRHAGDPVISSSAFSLSSRVAAGKSIHHPVRVELLSFESRVIITLNKWYKSISMNHQSLSCHFYWWLMGWWWSCLLGRISGNWSNAVPQCRAPPTESVALLPVQRRSFWRSLVASAEPTWWHGGGLLARWPSEIIC